VELRDIHQWAQKDVETALDLCDEALPVKLHSMAFSPPLLSQGSEELVRQYGALAKNHGILGAYAQTELGHGSNVAAVETAATFIPESQEFEIHSPTLTSTKWWIGSGGLVASHAIVQAQLILPHNKRMGPHLFLVQLRDADTHGPLPGILTGDIGAKAFSSSGTNDNGFIRFHRVRIPRSAMLSRFADVSENGEYTVPPHSKLSYGGMLYIRSGMITACGWQLAKAITIATRYATVRRQGGPSGKENAIIDYPSVYYRLIPLISKAYVYIILGRHLRQSFEKMSQKLASGDTSELAETHAVLSAMKSRVTASTIESLEVARRSMGGHGFLADAGAGRIYADHVPSATFEGDNYLLDHQVVRAALKAHARFKSDPHAKLSLSTRYLRTLADATPGSVNWLDPAYSIHLLERRASAIVSTYEGENEDAGAAHRLSMAVADAFVAARVGEMFRIVGDRTPQDTQNVLWKVLLLHLLMIAESALADLLAFGILKLPDAGRTNPMPMLRSEISHLCVSLLPERIALTDSFGFTDWELDSALGVYDGKVYERLWEKAQGNPLNKLDAEEVHGVYLKPILDRGRQLAGLASPKL